MCLAFFIGEGYCTSFTVNMKNMLDVLTAGAQVRLHIGADEICRGCPNRTGHVCTAEEKIKRYDAAVLAACGLKDGDVLPFEEFARKVEENIIAAGNRSAICGNCRWDYICSSTKSRWDINQV